MKRNQNVDNDGDVVAIDFCIIGILALDFVLAKPWCDELNVRYWFIREPIYGWLSFKALNFATAFLEIIDSGITLDQAKHTEQANLVNQPGSNNKVYRTMAGVLLMDYALDSLDNLRTTKILQIPLQSLELNKFRDKLQFDNIKADNYIDAVPQFLIVMSHIRLIWLLKVPNLDESFSVQRKSAVKVTHNSNLVVKQTKNPYSVLSDGYY
uniref:Uncharacterized protein n=1 Tax=Glossina austeni TaxID=7395 RepID=A0A1A9VD94_GLOAU